jgi:hypothetical protein
VKVLVCELSVLRDLALWPSDFYFRLSGLRVSTAPAIFFGEVEININQVEKIYIATRKA